MKKMPRKELLLETADKLFNTEGYHQVGIDRILLEAGVSKATLYKHFPSKDALILEVLKRRSESRVNSMHALIEQAISVSPKKAKHKHLRLILNAFHEWVNSHDFYGCNFIKAGSEFYDIDHEIHQFAAIHKQRNESLIASLFNTLDKKEARELAKNIMLILDGAIVTAQIRGNKNAIKEAQSIIDLLLLKAGLSLN